MKAIADLVDHIDDELNGAKEYAENYLMAKAANNSTRAQHYREMAEDELKHAKYIHDHAITEIEKLRTVYTPPAEMEEMWTAAHKKYIERAAWIKQMLQM